ncbi:hypothetical protein ODJ79_09020 [Actinoplanes sp. KI2]|uniref:hypothetical protein n=1 Tax=Actinoplanes sp. KI2 TaxID=2983315 RepID=UPI0021D59867|nr:hypothetical protein [Actinoplanes sp. KI2]MCU7723853.1 hypothetical protein [Actinoplanes sp. KI2]
MGDPVAGLVGAVCVVFAVLVATIAWVSVRRQRRDRDRMRDWAGRNGWAFTLKPNVDWGRRLPGGNRNGVAHTFTRVLSGRQVTVGEYSVTDAGDGTTTNTHHYVITVVQLRRSFPATAVEARSRTSRVATRIFGPGDTATGDTDFDRGFRIRTTEPSVLHQWFTPALIAAHLAGRVPGSWSVQGADLLCHRPGHLDPDQISGHAAAALPLADLLERPNLP